MRRTLLAALALCALAACTTSFEADQLRARADATVDAPDAPVVTPDASADGSDGASPGCGVESGLCCTDGNTPACRGDLVCLGGVCARCPTGLTGCEGTCVNLASNARHCGRCGMACAEGFACTAGSCAVSCAPGLDACGSDCVQRLTDPRHCGRCGNACSLPGAVSSCANGVCGFARCQPGFGDCDRDPSNGCEVNLATSAAHCGACGMRCVLPGAMSSVCEAGECRVTTCLPGREDCDRDPANGCEVDTQTNAAHCGVCGRVCRGVACSNGACAAPTMDCMSGTADCRSTVTGCETDTTNDANNCGACGNVCALPNATTSRCTAGACAVAVCAEGFGDCDGVAANGCETDLRTDAANCGRCGVRCGGMGDGVCSNRVCQLACPAGRADCNANAADGCESDLATSALNCGACGSACLAANGTPACVGGRCAVSTCDAGFGDCDGNAGNGCETNLLSAVSSCGACGVTCSFANAAATCAMGRCVRGACNAGFGDCDGDPANGCEVDLRNDPSHCGACPTACTYANGAPRCAEGRCATGVCNAGFADCDGNAANGCEANLATSVQHCGRCGSACAAGQTCSAGVCGVGCAAGLVACASLCVDLQTNRSNCGRCGNACPTGANASATCVNGACALTCNPNWGDCDGDARNGCETDLRTSLRNCGACGTLCATPSNATALCASSTCGSSCNANYGNCDGMSSNGCEVRLTDDVNHCGRCGNVCSFSNAVSKCVTGGGTTRCEIDRCQPRFANCDGLRFNGCEVNTQTDWLHCGGCVRPCGLLQRCVDGRCQ